MTEFKVAFTILMTVFAFLSSCDNQERIDQEIKRIEQEQIG